MEMHQVRYFLAVARFLNFTRAAEECHVAQPSLTRAIQKLEEEFGGLLFHRERARTHLTVLGEAMLPHLTQTYQSAISAKALAVGIARGTDVPLRLGVGGSVASHMLRQLVQALGDTVEGVDLTLGRASEEAVLEKALDGGFDLVIISEPEELPERMRGWPLFSEGMHFVVPAGHRLAGHEVIGLDDLAGEWLVRQDGCPCMGELIKIAATAHVVLQIHHHVGNRDDLMHLVASGFGLGIVPAHAPLVAGVVAVPACAILARRVILAVVAGRPFNAAADVCVKLARSRSWEIGRAA
ncbi:MAG: LysR family transcriptional regulator [Phreatobacter sp.]